MRHPSLLDRIEAEARTPFEHATTELLRSMLYKMYESQFTVIDGYLRHPDPLNFQEWLAREFRLPEGS